MSDLWSYLLQSISSSTVNHDISFDTCSYFERNIFSALILDAIRTMTPVHFLYRKENLLREIENNGIESRWDSDVLKLKRAIYPKAA